MSNSAKQKFALSKCQVGVVQFASNVAMILDESGLRGEEYSHEEAPVVTTFYNNGEFCANLPALTALGYITVGAYGISYLSDIKAYCFAGARDYLGKLRPHQIEWDVLESVFHFPCSPRLVDGFTKKDVLFLGPSELKRIMDAEADLPQSLATKAEEALEQFFRDLGVQKFPDYEEAVRLIQRFDFNTLFQPRLRVVSSCIHFHKSDKTYVEVSISKIDPCGFNFDIKSLDVMVPGF